MNTARLHSVAAGVQASAAKRTIHVHQNFFPGPTGVMPDGPHITHLGHGWAAAPKALLVNGKSYPVMHSRVPGEARSTYHVSMPTLGSGPQDATVILANGAKVAVTLDVQSAY